MKDKRQLADLKRRGFLLAGGAGAAGAVVAVVAPGIQSAAPVSKAPSPAADAVGYQDTAHVRTYYDLARV